VTRFVVLAASVAALGGLLFGYDTGVISGAILFVAKGFALSTATQEFVVSVVLIGCVLGAAGAGWLADRYGRKRTLLCAGVVFGLGALGSAFAPNVELLVAARFVVGIAIGISSVVSPLYISEVAPARYRGGLVSLYQFAITIGILGAFLVDYAFSASGAWRPMLGLALVPSVALVVGMLVMPESPRYLFKIGRRERASAELGRIYGDAESARVEETTIEAGLQLKEAGFEAFRLPDFRWALFIGVALAVLQQVTGINTVIYYGPHIFTMAGYGTAGAAILATAAVGVVNVVMTLVAIFFSDGLGRKPLLYIGCAGMAVALLSLAGAFAFSGTGAGLGPIALVSLMLYVGCFAFSLGPIVWVLIAEIYPLRSRGLGMSVATLANWGANFVVSQFFLTMVEKFGASATFSIYAVLCIVTLVFVARFVPETKRQSLERIRVRA